MKRSSKAKKDESGIVKKRHKFNFIDFILILLAVLLVLTAINIISPMSVLDKLKSNDTHTIYYTVELLGVDEEYIGKIAEKDNVVDSVSKHSLGSVITVDYNTPHRVLEYNEEKNEGKLATYPSKYKDKKDAGKIDVLITITARASYKAGEGYAVNGHRIAVGEKMSLRFPNYVGEGYCIGFSDEG